jgi:hypothetical protein
MILSGQSSSSSGKGFLEEEVFFLLALFTSMSPKGTVIKFLLF